jgi:hypothetical protein
MKPREVFDFVTTSDVKWCDPNTGLRLAPGAIQNWPTASTEHWLAQQKKHIRTARAVEQYLASPADPKSRDAQ